jgi:hypothetical protein
MDFIKKLKISSSILGLLVLIFVAGLIFSPESISRKRSVQRILEKIKADDIQALMLYGDEKPVFMEKTAAEGWTVKLHGRSLDADAVKINDFISVLLKLKKHREAGRTEGDLSVFGLDDENVSRVVVKLKGGSERTLFIGRSAAGEKGEYMYADGSPKLYISDVSAGFYTDRNAEYWIELGLLPKGTNSAAIISMQFTRKAGFKDKSLVFPDYTLRRTEKDTLTEWEASGLRGALSQEKADNIAGNIARLAGSSISEETAVNNPAGIITVETDDGKLALITIAAEENENSYSISSSVKLPVFTVYRWKIEELLELPQN